MPKSLLTKVLLVSLFAIAMGFLESAVVVYLRELYYPEGFAFPLKIMTGTVALTEIFREAATMVMLATVAMFLARKWIVRFAWFIYLFAIWDIFFYIFLYLLLGWPPSLLTWDLLFLIPTVWVGPVLAPVINSLTMVLLAMVIVRTDDVIARSPAVGGTTKQGGRVKLGGVVWGLLIAGSLITIFAYIQDYSAFLLDRFSLSDLFCPCQQPAIADHASRYVPQHFNWWLFLAGEALFLLAVFRVWRINRKV